MNIQRNDIVLYIIQYRQSNKEENKLPNILNLIYFWLVTNVTYKERVYDQQGVILFHERAITCCKYLISNTSHRQNIHATKNRMKFVCTMRSVTTRGGSETKYNRRYLTLPQMVHLTFIPIQI
jgi:hypothetical protein